MTVNVDEDPNKGASPPSTAAATPTPPPAASRARAQGRWRLLRQAIVQAATAEKDPQHSMHAFAGFRLLPEAQSATTSFLQYLSKKLVKISRPTELVPSILALTAINASMRSLKLEIIDSTATSTLTSSPSDMDLQALAVSLKQACEWKTCACQWVQAIQSSVRVLKITYQPSNEKPQYKVVRYQVPCADISTLTVLARQRMRQQKLSLVELTSQQTNSGVDNTGNVCVWDCSQTLAWAVHQEKTVVHRVTELGAGMVALAGLSLAVGNRLHALHVTDGHAQAVQNNSVHVRMLHAIGCFADVNVTCSVLKWSLDVETSKDLPPPANWTLVADCTHFEEYHAALLWTLCQTTAVQGCVWMCQPTRAGTWQRYADLVQAVNSSSSAKNGALWDIQERHYPVLQAKHEEYLSDPTYDPDRHCPRIFVLTKLREQQPQDKQAAISYTAQHTTQER